MIKKIKPISLFIATIIAFLIGSSNVFAFKEGEFFTKQTASSSWEDNYYKVNGESKGATLYFQHGYDNATNTPYDFYCLDGIRKAPSVSQVPNLKVQSVLNNADPVDAVILYIINAEGYSYNTKLTAMRAFTPLTKKYASFESTLNGDYTAIYSIINSGVYWSSEASLQDFSGIFKKFCIDNNCDTDPGSRGDITPQEVYNHLLGYNLFSKKPSDIPNYSFDISKYTLDESNGTVSSAKKLLLEAMAYGAKVKENNITGKSVKIMDKDISDKLPVELTNSNEDVRDLPNEYRSISFKVAFEGFASNDVKSSVKLHLTKDSNNNLVDITKTVYRVYGSNDEWKEFNGDTDFASLMTSDNVIIEVEARLEGKVKTSEAVEIGFIVDPEYTVQGELSGAYLVPIGALADVRQRFFVGSGSSTSPRPDDTKEPISFKWNPTASVCETRIPDENDIDGWRDWMKECCDSEKGDFNVVNECAKNGNDENNKWCQLKKKYCDVCNTTVDVPKDCSEFSEGEYENGKKATITGPEKVKLCVINYSDSAKTHNSRQLTKDTSVNSNPYCKVYCKEDYSMTLPAGRYVISGRYFTLQMAVKGTKTCYTDDIKINEFNEDIELYTKQLEAAIQTGDAALIKETYGNYSDALRDIQKCEAGWKDDYDFNPDISFTYQEDYITKQLGTSGLKFTSDNKEKTSENWFCTGNDVDITYSKCIGGSESKEMPTRDIKGYTCQPSGNTYKCSETTIKVPTAKFAYKKVTGTGLFTPDSVFYTKYSTGVITAKPGAESCKLGEATKDGNNCKYTMIEKTLHDKIPDSDKEVTEQSGIIPVSLKTNKGVYTYNLEFNNVGEFFDKNASGRLIDSDESKHSIAGAEFADFKGNYVCAYVVNCPSCGFKCVPNPEIGLTCETIEPNTPTPDTPTCDGKNCDIKCTTEGCLYDNEHGFLASVHQSSIENFAPGSAGRKVGQNWDASINKKAEAAIESISEKGESIYKEPEYSFTFTPAVITAVREYNKEQQSNGGYLNDSMYCKNYSSIRKDEKVTAENDYLVCKSELLDMLENEAKNKTSGFKVQARLDTFKEVESFLQSKYCKENTCALVGNIGPAWK